MKTNYLRISALCLMFFSLVTATKAQLGSHLGVAASPSLSGFYGEGAASYDVHYGYAGGIIYQYAFSPAFALHTGLMYENKGGNTQQTLGSTGIELRNSYNFNYLTVPVLFRAHLMPGARVRPFINAGPNVGYLVNQTTVVQADDRGEVTTDRVNATDNYHRFDVGASGGVGVDFLIGKTMHLDLEVRDNMGFYNVNKVDDQKMYNNSVNFLVTAIWSLPTMTK